jgi:hypothetical protein
LDLQRFGISFQAQSHAYEHRTQIVIPGGGLQQLALPSQYSEARESYPELGGHFQLSKNFESQYWCTKFIQGKLRDSYFL